MHWCAAPSLLILLGIDVSNGLNLFPYRPPNHIYKSRLSKKTQELHFQDPYRSHTMQPIARKDQMLQALASLRSTASPAIDHHILELVRDLETQCPTQDSDVVDMLAGQWELVWTFQDDANNEEPNSKKRLRRPFISSSSFETRKISFGRLQRLGHIAKARQRIDDRDDILYNSVGKGRSLVSLNVRFEPNVEDPRRIETKCESLSMSLEGAVDTVIPLGNIGPVGWLRTTYIDNNLRISRGNFGTIFVLKRQN